MATEVKDLCRQDVTLPTKVVHGAKYVLCYLITRIKIEIYSRTRFTGSGNRMEIFIRILA
jgi:hypothetical protein